MSAARPLLDPSARVDVRPLAAMPSTQRADWLTLFSAQPEPRFEQHPDWFGAIDAHLLPGALSVASVRDDSGPLALVPLIGAGGPRPHHPRHEHFARADVLIRPDLAPAAALAALGTALDAAAPAAADWRIADLPEGTPLAQAIAAAAEADPEATWRWRESRRNARFALDTDGALVPGNLRRNLRRRRRRLADEGELRIERATTPEALAAAFERFLALEGSGWKGDAGTGTAIANDPTLRAFYAALLSPSHPSLAPVINLMWLEGRAIAAQYALATKGCLSLLKIAYDEEYAAFSPGSLLLESMLESAREEGLAWLDLVTGPTWAARWHPTERPLWHATRYVRSHRGRSLAAIDRLGRAARGAQARWRDTSRDTPRRDA